MSMMDWTQDKWPEFIHQKLKHVYESEKEPREKDGDRNDREKGKDRDRELGAEGQGDRDALLQAPPVLLHFQLSCISVLRDLDLSLRNHRTEQLFVWLAVSKIFCHCL